MLRVDARGEASDSPVIRSLALRILELVVESHARKHVQVGYGWPVIIAGAMLDDEPSRQKVRVAVEFFRHYCLFEVLRASAVLDDVRRRRLPLLQIVKERAADGRASRTQLWALRDAGDRTTTWRALAARDGGFAFV
jgi:hypothetical protein